ncbi:MAG: hypothetical protein RLZZ616_2196 [Pseudomonadota bacterium]
MSGLFVACHVAGQGDWPRSSGRDGVRQGEPADCLCLCPPVCNASVGASQQTAVTPRPEHMIVILIQASACQQDTRVQHRLEDGSHMMDNKKATLRLMPVS